MGLFGDPKKSEKDFQRASKGLGRLLGQDHKDPWTTERQINKANKKPKKK